MADFDLYFLFGEKLLGYVPEMAPFGEEQYLWGIRNIGPGIISASGESGPNVAIDGHWPTANIWDHLGLIYEIDELARGAVTFLSVFQAHNRNETLIQMEFAGFTGTPNINGTQICSLTAPGLIVLPVATSGGTTAAAIGSYCYVRMGVTSITTGIDTLVELSTPHLKTGGFGRLKLEGVTGGAAVDLNKTHSVRYEGTHFVRIAVDSTAGATAGGSTYGWPGYRPSSITAGSPNTLVVGLPNFTASLGASSLVELVGFAGTAPINGQHTGTHGTTIAIAVATSTGDTEVVPPSTVQIPTMAPFVAWDPVAGNSNTNKIFGGAYGAAWGIEHTMALRLQELTGLGAAPSPGVPMPDAFGMVKLGSQTETVWSTRDVVGEKRWSSLFSSPSSIELFFRLEYLVQNAVKWCIDNGYTPRVRGLYCEFGVNEAVRSSENGPTNVTTTRQYTVTNVTPGTPTRFDFTPPITDFVPPPTGAGGQNVLYAKLIDYVNSTANFIDPRYADLIQTAPGVYGAVHLRGTGATIAGEFSNAKIEIGDPTNIFAELVSKLVEDIRTHIVQTVNNIVPPEEEISANSMIPTVIGIPAIDYFQPPIAPHAPVGMEKVRQQLASIDLGGMVSIDQIPYSRNFGGISWASVGLLDYGKDVADKFISARRIIEGGQASTLSDRAVPVIVLIGDSRAVGAVTNLFFNSGKDRDYNGNHDQNRGVDIWNHATNEPVDYNAAGTVSNTIPGRNAGSEANVGPDSSLGIEMKDTYYGDSENVVILKIAQGGALLSKPGQPQFAKAAGELWAEIEQSFGALQSYYSDRGKCAVPVGVFTVLGYNDAQFDAVATFESGIQQFIANVRELLTVSVKGEAVPFVWMREPIHAAIQSNATLLDNINRVNAAIDLAGTQVPGMVVINIDENEDRTECPFYPIHVDGVHLSGEATVNLGKAFAKAYDNVKGCYA